MIEKETLLDKKEWNFETNMLPQREVPACHAHEYGRELIKRCPQISKLLRIVWRAKRFPKVKARRIGALLAEKKLRSRQIPTTLFCERSQYLNWYSLRKAVRESACKEAEEHRIFEVGFSISTERELEPSRFSTMELY